MPDRARVAHFRSPPAAHPGSVRARSVCACGAAPKTLAELEEDVARDLALTAHPRAPWLEPKRAGGAPVLDCLAVGGGQCGLALAFALKRSRADNLLVVDRAPPGREGP